MLPISSANTSSSLCFLHTIIGGLFSESPEFSSVDSCLPHNMHALPPADAASYLAYLDSFLSKSSPHPYSLPTSPRPTRIEDVLMQRHRVAQSHLYTLKALHQDQELREMRPVPKINSLSKRLAKGMLRPPLVPEKERQKKGGGKEEEKEGGLGEARSEARIAPPPPLELRCHVSLESGTISPVIPTVNNRQSDNLRFPAQSGVLSLEALRRRVLEKYDNSELLEPPAGLLNMEVLERQDYFVEKRDQKLKKERILKAQAESRQCTFRPALNSSRSLTTSRSDHSSRSLSASRSHQRSYYERYVYSKSVKTSLNHTASNIKPSSSRAGSRKTDSHPRTQAWNYQPLSPASQRVSFRSGLNLNAFLATAKPMVSYRDADVEKAKAAPRSSRSRGRS